MKRDVLGAVWNDGGGPSFFEDDKDDVDHDDHGHDGVDCSDNDDRDDDDNEMDEHRDDAGVKQQQQQW
jgi:hypothetical protein